MGYAGFQAKSNIALQKHIRAVAKDSAMVVITNHARVRMRERLILEPEVYEILRRGTIERPPVANPQKGSLECRMQWYGCGREIAAVVALSDEDPNMIVVTVMEIGS